MPCDKYLELLSARLDGELTPQEHTQLSDHLDSCPSCRAAAHQLEDLHTAMGELEVSAPSDLTDSVLHTIQAEKRTSRRRWLRRWISLAACLVLTVGILRISDAVYFDSQRQQEASGPAVARNMDPDSQPFAMAAADPLFTDPHTTAVTWGSTPAAPCAVVLGSQASLADFISQFPQDDLSALTATYDADFFREHRLLAVVVEANSGSIIHTLAPDGLTYDSVTVSRSTPQAFTCDMAAWLLTAQVDNTFADGQQLAVLFVD